MEIEEQAGLERLLTQAAGVIRSLERALGDARAELEIARRRAEEAERQAAVAQEHITLVVKAAVWATLQPQAMGREVTGLPSDDETPSEVRAIDLDDGLHLHADDDNPAGPATVSTAVEHTPAAPDHRRYRRPVIGARSAAALVGLTTAVLTAVFTVLPLHQL